MKLITRLAALVGILAAVQCGQSSSPMAPNSTITVALNPPSVNAGTTTHGTVTVGSATTAAATIALTSSNTAVATVPATITVPAGASTGTFTVTAVAPGSATIVATLNAASAQSTVTVTAAAAGVALAAISVADPNVTEGNGSSGTVTLTAAAPAGGASVTMAGSAAIIVPTSVIVNAGATSATFSYLTKAGTGATSGTITASYGGAASTATVTIVKPTVATARFGVTGPNESETCEMANSGKTLECTFNASTSSAPGTIVSYQWTYTVAGSFSQTTTGATLTNPAVDCSLLPSPPLASGSTFLPLTVTLRIRDDRGNVADATDGSARVLPMHTCGF